MFGLDTRALGGPGREETRLLIPLMSVRLPTHILLQGLLHALLKSLPESLPKPRLEGGPRDLIKKRSPGSLQSQEE